MPLENRLFASVRPKETRRTLQFMALLRPAFFWDCEMTSATALVWLAVGIAFGSLVLAAAIRPKLLISFWKLLRLLCLLGWIYFGSSMIASAISVLQGDQTLYDFSGGNDYWPLSESVLWLAIVCGVISLIGRFVAGKDAVPWIFGDEVDPLLFISASVGLIWFSFFLIQVGIDFFGVSNAGFGAGILSRVVVYGPPLLMVVAVLFTTLYVLRVRRKADEQRP